MAPAEQPRLERGAQSLGPVRALALRISASPPRPSPTELSRRYLGQIGQTTMIGWNPRVKEWVHGQDQDTAWPSRRRHPTVDRLWLGAQHLCSGSQPNSTTAPASSATAAPVEPSSGIPTTAEELQSAFLQLVASSPSYPLVSRVTISPETMVAAQHPTEPSSTYTYNDLSWGAAPIGFEEPLIGDEGPAIAAEQLPVGELYYEAADKLNCEDLHLAITIAHNGQLITNARCGAFIDNAGFVKLQDQEWDESPAFETAEGTSQMIAILRIMGVEQVSTIGMSDTYLRITTGEPSLQLPDGTSCDQWELGFLPSGIKSNCLAGSRNSFAVSELNLEGLPALVQQIRDEGDAAGGLSANTVTIGYGHGVDKALIGGVTTENPPRWIAYEMDGVTRFQP